MAYSQNNNPKNLPEVEIHSTETGNLIHGLELKSDSLRSKHLSSLNLPEYLLRESFLNLRSYGPGMVSSITSQGGNAPQFQVLWNGIPINHLMLGQTDASILPFPLIRNVHIMSGQNSLSFGSGAMSGQIFLQSFSQTNDSSCTFAIGQAFNSLKVNQTTLQFGLKKTNINFLNINGQNSYPYTKENHQIRANQPIHQTALNANHKLILKNHRIVTDILLNRSERYMGNYARGIFDLSQKMNDILFLPSIHHAFYHEKFKLENKMYFNYSKLHYLNSLANINSLSEIFRGGGIHAFSLTHHNIQIRIKGESHFAQINTNNYAKSKPFHYFNLAQMVRYSFIKNLLSAECGTRVDYFTVSRKIPITYYAGLNGNIFSLINYYIKYSTSFRHPTANELFWNPGGNPDLKPETSKGTEVGVGVNFPFQKWNFSSDVEIFNRITDNNILWTPGPSGFPTPINIQKVWSRGLLSKSTLHYSDGPFYLSINSISAYVLSTILKSYFENSEDIIGRQLIYTPRYKLNHSFTVSYKDFSLCIWHQYTGYRFTTSDNSQWLKPFHLCDISVNMPSLKKERKMALETSFMIQNIFNTSYEFISGYPMPGRIYQLQIKINCITSKNKNL
jgi:iron complex outermembrane receptor protein